MTGQSHILMGQKEKFVSDRLSIHRVIAHCQPELHLTSSTQRLKQDGYDALLEIPIPADEPVPERHDGLLRFALSREQMEHLRQQLGYALTFLGEYDR